MRFDTYMPCDALKPYIRKFVISEAAEERVYKVLPDTGIVIGFQYKGYLSVVNSHEDIRLSTAGVTGYQDAYRMFKNGADIGTVLVYFSDTGAPAFFKTPVHELFRETVSLDNFIKRSELLVLEEQLFAEQHDQNRIRLVENFLISRLRQPDPDPLVIAALSLIYSHGGNIKIGDLVKRLNISQSPLEKRFRKIVGASPKKFASLVRLKTTIRNYTPQSSLTSIGYDAGFFDQAHFIKEFKRFTGQTPDSFFQGYNHGYSEEERPV